MRRLRNRMMRIMIHPPRSFQVALYFSAHWCPPCRSFTPKLANAYSKNFSHELEVVFVSSDQDEAAFQEYYSSQPWLALPFGNRSLKEQLGKKYGVGVGNRSVK